jgi:hypothetical protein
MRESFLNDETLICCTLKSFLWQTLVIIIFCDLKIINNYRGKCSNFINKQNEVHIFTVVFFDTIKFNHSNARVTMRVNIDKHK